MGEYEKMKQWKCSYCKRTRETKDEVIVVPCLCGDFMEELNEDDFDGKNN